MVTSLLPKANILIHNVKRKKKCIADVSLWDPLAVAYIYDPPGLLTYLHVHTHTHANKKVEGCTQAFVHTHSTHSCTHHMV